MDALTRLLEKRVPDAEHRDRIEGDLRARHDDRTKAALSGSPEEVRAGFYVWPGDFCLYLDTSTFETGCGQREWVLRYGQTGSKDPAQQVAMLTKDTSWAQRHRQAQSHGFELEPDDWPDDFEPVTQLA